MTPPLARDERFVLVNHGGFTSAQLQRVQAQLDVGARALEKYIGPAATRKFPVVVNLRPGRGVSHSGHGQGAIELYWVGEVRAPIVHELTHVLAGYTAANGHWTQEGFASFMQDEYGEDTAFPTHKMDHALVTARSGSSSCTTRRSKRSTSPRCTADQPKRSSANG